jgi:hypothetical protein
MMNQIGSILLELALLSLLGVLYYYYQKKKLLDYEKNKVPLIMGHLLQSCMVERGDHANAPLDAVIEALDDYLQNKSPQPPIALLIQFANTPECSAELKDIILEGVREVNS